MTALAIAGFWSLALWGLVSRRPVLLWLFFGMLPFGAFTVIPPQLTGGLSILAVSVTAALLVARQFLLRRHGLEDLLTLALRGPGVLLTLFWAASVLVTLFVPRLLEGRVDIVPMAVNGYAEVAPLRPTMQNFSQLAYITVSVLSVFAFASLFRAPRSQNLLLRGLLFAGAVTVVTGILSYLAAFLPIDRFLAPFKTAEYALLDQATLSDGTRRITGLMPEASSYGALTLMLLSALYFLRRAIDDRVGLLRANFTVVLLAVLLVMSTSSAGYVGLGVLLLLIGWDGFVRTFRIHGARFAYRGVRQDFFLLLAVIGVVSLAVMLTPGVFDPVMQRLDEAVLQKTDSGSYIERSAWTATSLQAGFDSYMGGVGLGSTRTSNFAVAIFASTGLVGFLLYFGFVGRLLLTPLPGDDPHGQLMSSALKWSFFPSFAVGLLIATTPDFGVFEALRFGALLALLGNAARPAHAASPAERPAGPRAPTSAPAPAPALRATKAGTPD